jgi:hypothetical protein
MGRILELKYHLYDGRMPPAGRVFEKHVLHWTSAENNKTPRFANRIGPPAQTKEQV